MTAEPGCRFILTACEDEYAPISELILPSVRNSYYISIEKIGLY